MNSMEVVWGITFGMVLGVVLAFIVTPNRRNPVMKQPYEWNYSEKTIYIDIDEEE